MNPPKRLRVLWLCSWYPSEVDVFAGDFIQRHAEAASIFCDITVIHCIGNEKIANAKKTQSARKRGLVERIGYYPRSGVLNRILSPLRWMFLTKELVDDFIKQEGLPDLVHVQVLFKSGLAARYLRWRFGIPYVVTEHWGGYNDVVQDRFSTRPFWFRWVTQFAYNKAVISFSVSAYQAKSLDNELKPLSNLIIRNVVNTDLFKTGDCFVDKYTFIHISDWSINKNPEGILRAFSRFHRNNNQVKLVMVGGKGSNAKRVEQFLGGSYNGVELFGEVAYTEVANIMRRAQCLLLFSKMESASCVVAEALCVGLQVIATDVGGVPEIIDPVCSYLVPDSDEDLFYLAMIDAFAKHVTLNRESISDRAKNIFSYAKVGKEFEESYMGVLGKKI
jgi:glycosyltransferase involved in cell wall biosynthesis